MSEYEPVIGLEVHAQLLTRSKLFCGCSTTFGASPNANTCAVCLGMPGALPVVNSHAVSLAVRAAKGLNCQVHMQSEWSRKNYFYPDLPKGYQISQNDKPLATAGCLNIEVDNQTLCPKITRIHMEEDAGKNVHDDMLAGARSYVDFNRGGIALIEIVGEPDLRSAVEAATYLKTLRQVLRYLQVCDGNMDEGSLRCDVNVSVRPVGSSVFGTRVEVKNINSFRFIQQAIDFEIARQIAVLKSGGRVVQETRLWDSQAKESRSMRSKEQAHDYRFFPEPDLPNLQLDLNFVQNIEQHLPELPAAKIERYVAQFGLSYYDARVLTDDADVAQLFEQAIAIQPNYKAVANWIINELLRELKNQSLVAMPQLGQQLGELVALIDAGDISGKIAKTVFVEMLQNGQSPRAIVQAKGLSQVSDVSALKEVVAKVIAAYPDSVQTYLRGKTNVVGFLVGQVMQQTKGRADPKIVNQLLIDALKLSQ